MPTLATKKSAKNINATTTARTTTTAAATIAMPAMTTISTNHETTATTAATCTFSIANSDYQQAKQQKQQHQQQQLYNHYHYAALSPMSSQQHPQQQQQQAVLNSQHYDVMATTGTAPTGVTTATSLTTFNGNSDLILANGNIGGNSNSNGSTSTSTSSSTIIMSSTTTNCNSNNNNNNSSGDSSKTETSTNSNVANAAAVAADAIIISGSGGGSITSSNSGSTGIATVNLGIASAVDGTPCSSAAAAAMKKTVSANALHALHASREDITSLGGASSVNSQISANNNNNNNSNNSSTNGAIGGMASSSSIISGNNNNSNSSITGIIKGSKENLLQNYYNGISGVVATGAAINAELDDPGDGLGPLPPKWETAYTERGELYFIDHNTGTSHWLDPRLSKFQKKLLEDCSDDELPYGWEKIEDSLYGTYYIDHVNRRTQYENPVFEAKRRAAEQKQRLQQQQHQHQQQLRPQTPSVQNIGMSGLNGAALSSGGRAVLNNSPLIAAGNINLDISQRGMQPPPPPPPLASTSNNFRKSLLPYKFTRNPAEIQGERITTTLLKSARGLGITIVGGDDGADEFLQIKSIVPNGPAWLDGRLQMGDVLVYVNDTCVLGFTHHEMVNVFQSILPGETVILEVCRGYPLPFDPNDPNTEVVTTIAVDGLSTEPEKHRRILMDLNMDGNYNFLDVSAESNGAKSSLDAANSGFILMKKPEIHTFSIVKGAMGFGFTIADSAYGQKVKKILDRNCCTHLQEGDMLLEINDVSVRNKSHLEVVQILKECSKIEPTTVKIQRGGAGGNGSGSGITGGTHSPTGYNTSAAIATSATAAVASAGGNVAKLRKNFISNAGLFRSKTPTADIYSTQQKEILPIRPKTPLVDTRSRARVKTPNNELNDAEVAAATTNGAAAAVDANLDRSLADSKTQIDAKSTNSLQEIDAINQEIPYMDPYPKLVTSLSERLAEATLLSDSLAGNSGAAVSAGGPTHMGLDYHAAGMTPITRSNYENQEYATASGNYNPIYGLSTMPPTMSPINPLQHHNVAQHLSPNNPTTPLSLMTTTATAQPSTLALHHHESCYCYDCQDYRNQKYRQHQQQAQTQAHNYYIAHHQMPTTSTATLLSPHSHHHPQYSPASIHANTTSPLQAAAHIQNERMQKRVNELLNDRRKVGFSPLDTPHHSTGGYIQQQQHSPAVSSISQQQSVVAWPNSAGAYNTLQPSLSMAVGNAAGLNMRNGVDIIDDAEQFELTEVTLERQALGFGFRIVGGTEEGSQVTVGHIVPGGAADNDQRITTGDEILSIDGINVLNSSHHKVVSLMGEAALRGQVTMILRRRTLRTQHQLSVLQQQQQQQQQQHHQQSLSMPMRAAAVTSLRYPYDVIVSRHENEGFGFVIISSSNQYYGSTIGKLIPGSPADRCGELKVGDRIIAVNRIDIAGMSHGDVVNLIKESGLHVRLTIGCPKEGSTGSGGGGGGGNTLLINSAQASPGQISQTQLTLAPTTALTLLSTKQQQQQSLHQHQQQQAQLMQQTQHELMHTPNANYFERPVNASMLNANSAVLLASGLAQNQQQHQQQQQLHQQLPHL